jgi:divalent metal cation (Fe/Co/Zn/Cd) transporter
MPVEVGDRRAALLRGSWLCAATVAWNTVVGGAAVATAIGTGSLALIGFGLDALIDSAASVVLVWRLRAEAHGADPERTERIEGVAVRVAGTALVAVGVYLAVASALALARGSHAESSAFGVAQALGSVVVLPPLAVGKLRIAAWLPSRALRADGILTTAGASLALVTLAGLILERWAGWWWADRVAALGIAMVLVRQGVSTLRVLPKAE